MFKIQKIPNLCNASPQEIGKSIEDVIQYYKERADKFQQINLDLHKHAKEYVDNELKQENERLRARLALSYGEFASQKEKDKYLNFEHKHLHDRLTSKYNGGRAPYLIPTGVGFGTSLIVKCPICGEEQDITDTEAW